MTMVNGLRIGSDKPKELRSGYRVILGDVHVFRFNHPEEVRKNRDSKQILPSSLKNEVHSSGQEEAATLSGRSSPIPDRPPSPTSSNVDWSYARREAVVAKLNGTDVDLEKLDDTELNRLL
jgi:kinesin family protein 1